MALISTNNGIAGTKQAVTSAYQSMSIVTAAASAPRRGRVYDVFVGTIGTPADQTYEWDISRQTAIGTATTCGPNALDPADANFTTLATGNATAEGTVTASSSVWYLGVNQRASYRWVAAPGSELVWPATASNGFTLRTRSASGGTAVATTEIFVNEQ